MINKQGELEHGRGPNLAGRRIRRAVTSRYEQCTCWSHLKNSSLWWVGAIFQFCFTARHWGITGLLDAVIMHVILISPSARGCPEGLSTTHSIWPIFQDKDHKQEHVGKTCPSKDAVWIMSITDEPFWNHGLQTMGHSLFQVLTHVHKSEATLQPIALQKISFLFFWGGGTVF